jgi:hypothetical protein
MKFILMGLIKRFTKEMGRSPNPGELSNLKKMAKEMERSEKVIPFPESRITDPFKTETEAEILARMKRQNKESVERLKKKKEKDLGERLKDLPDDIPDMADGGRIGFSVGGGLMKLLKAMSENNPFQAYKKYLQSVKRRAQTEPEKLAPELGAVAGGGILVNRQMKRILEEMNEQDKEINLENFKQQLDNDPFYDDRPELKDKIIERYMEREFGEKKAAGGLATAVKKLKKKFGKDIIQKGKAPKDKGGRKELRKIIEDFKRRNMAGGGLAGFAGDQVESSQYDYVMSDIPGSPQIPMGQIGPVNVGIFGGGGFSKNQIVPGVDLATTDQNFGIMGQIPIGDTGFSIGGDYMKSRVNQRFTGGDNQVFKSVPVDEDQYNIGINFRKQFSEGGMSRRTFIKLLGGLASIPVLSKFVTPFKQAAPVVAETAKEVPAYFFKLVDKIRRLGDDAPGLTTVEREVGKKYKNYEMVEDQTTGDIVIKKQKQGSAAVGDDMVEGTVSEEVIAYRTPKSTADGRIPADYEEITVKPDFEGKMRDVEDGLDSMGEILEEVGETQLKKAGGGLAYMLGE